jgi:hypothetical protein
MTVDCTINMQSRMPYDLRTSELDDDKLSH